MSPLKRALAAATLGWPVIPCGEDKRPLTKRGLKDASTDPEQIRAWWKKHPDALPAVVAGPSGLAIADLDRKGGKDGVAACERLGKPLPATWRQDTPSGGMHAFYLAPGAVEMPNGAADLFEKSSGIDRRTGESYAILYSDPPASLDELVPAPDWLVEVRERTVRDGADRAPHADLSEYEARCAPGKPDKAVRAALEAVKPDGMTHDDMLEAVSALVALGARGARGVPAALEQARATYATGWQDADRQWDNAVAGSIRRHGLPPITLPMTKAEKAATKNRPTPDRSEDDARMTAETPEGTIRQGDDASLALIVAERFKRSLVYVAGGWREYETGRWRQISEARVVELVRALLRDDLAVAAVKADRANVAQWLTRMTTIGNAARLIRGRLERPIEDFDAHPDELNVRNGIVDLRTLELRPHDPERFHTKLVPFDYKPGAEHVDWTAALTALPPRVRGWMQIRFGQAATGHTPDDDRLVILQGKGANGKSTIIAAVQTALGDYSTTVPDKLLLGSANDHPTVKMELLGARLTVAEELPEGRSLNVRQLKEVIGTTRIKGRYMRQDFVEFEASHSLMVSSNYEPRVAETDHGTWRRLVLVRFPFRFVDEVRHEDERPGDRRLRSRLEAGRAGRGEAVLAWIVEGARQWYEAGMVTPEPPKRVTADTQAWREHSDLAFAFANDRLVFSEDSHMSASDLTQAVRTWLSSNGHTAWSTETIAGRVLDHDMLRDHNVRKSRRRLPDGSRPTVYLGMGLRPFESVLNSHLAAPSGAIH